MSAYPEQVSLMEGLKLLLPKAASAGTEEITLEEADGRILASDIVSDDNVPPFRRSPYDGYAIHAQDTAGASKEAPVHLSITEEIPAGSTAVRPVNEGEAVKIMTGAPVPDGLDAIIKFEDTSFTKEYVDIFSPVKTNSNIVPVGEDIEKGDLLLKKGEKLTPALVGILAGLGRSIISVYKKPAVSVLSTGDELVAVDEKISPGKIRNSSSYAIYSYLKEWNVKAKMLGIERDDAEKISNKIKDALSDSDLLITTGGVSVGDYDLLKEALNLIGADILFWKTNFKPGMAVIAAVYQEKVILALSGNPTAALICLFLFGQPLIRKMSGYQNYHTGEILVKLTEAFPKKSRTCRMLPGVLKIQDGEAWLGYTKKQGNGMLTPMQNCEIIGEIEAGSPPLERGTQIKAYRFS